jgi:hypothetical protein
VPRATPSKDAVARYDAMFAVYESLYPALAASMHRLAEVRESADRAD